MFSPTQGFRFFTDSPVPVFTAETTRRRVQTLVEGLVGLKAPFIEHGEAKGNENVRFTK